MRPTTKAPTPHSTLSVGKAESLGFRFEPGYSILDKVPPMPDLPSEPLDSAMQAALLDPAGSVNGLVFLLIAATGLLMALVYVPVRLYLTLTERSRRLRLLQRIRQLREELSKPVANA